MSTPFKTITLSGYTINFFCNGNYNDLCNFEENVININKNIHTDRIETYCEETHCRDCPLSSYNNPTSERCPSYPEYLYNLSRKILRVRKPKCQL